MGRLGEKYREVADLLNRDIDRLARYLLPYGQLEQGRYWRVGSLAGEEGQSLAVILTGGKQGRWFDYAAGIGGDGLDLVAGVSFNNDKREAFRWACETWLHMPDDWQPVAVQRQPRQTERSYVDAVRRAWSEARGLQRDDPVDRYLQGRGINLRELGKAPRALRYHPSLWNSDTQRCWPAMVAAIRSPEGELVAIHRTWLIVDPIDVSKAPIPDRHGETGGAKRTLGSYRGGYIRLWRGTDRSTCFVGEGIEDTLSAVLNRSAWRAVCAVSLSSMLVLELPPEIATVVILGQNDKLGSDADQLLRKVIQRFVAQQREVRLAKPPAFVKDWNDLAQWCRKKNVDIAWADWREGEADGRRAG